MTPEIQFLLPTHDWVDHVGVQCKECGAHVRSTNMSFWGTCSRYPLCLGITSLTEPDALNSYISLLHDAWVELYTVLASPRVLGNDALKWMSAQALEEYEPRTTSYKDMCTEEIEQGIEAAEWLKSWWLGYCGPSTLQMLHRERVLQLPIGVRNKSGVILLPPNAQLRRMPMPEFTRDYVESYSLDQFEARLGKNTARPITCPVCAYTADPLVDKVTDWGAVIGDLACVWSCLSCGTITDYDDHAYRYNWTSSTDGNGTWPFAEEIPCSSKAATRRSGSSLRR